MFIPSPEPPISFIKPDYLLRAENEYASRIISLEALRHIQKDAISELVAKQKDVGLKIVTDGGFTRVNGLRDFWTQFNGVTSHVVISGHLFQDRNAGEVIPKVTENITYNPSHDIFDNFYFMQQEAGDDTIVRIDLPAPALFYLDVIRNDWYDHSVYPDIDCLAKDIADAYNKTIKDLYRRGCRRLLLIDRSWGRLCNNIGSKRLLQGGVDITNLPEILRNINENSVGSMPDDMHIILYIPFDGVLNNDCNSIVERIFSHHRVDSMMIDMPYNWEQVCEMLSCAPREKNWIFGIEDTLQPQLMTHGELGNYLQKFSEVLPSSDIGLSTKGGFRHNSYSIDFSTFEDRDQWNKIKNLMSFGSHTIL